jgi:hypothetical protein
VCRDVAAQAALYQESVRDAAELADTTGVEAGQVGCVGVVGWLWSVHVCDGVAAGFHCQRSCSATISNLKNFNRSSITRAAPAPGRRGRWS